jgi:ATP-dependent helicase/nuclease subunit A
MTRARDRLYVVGMRKQKSNDDRRWHPLVEKALAPELTKRELPDGAIEYEWRADPPAAAALVPAPPTRPAADLPPWLATPALPPPAAKRLTPSALVVAEEGARAPATGRDQSAALERGRVIHRLLESLPDIAPENLAAIVPHWPAEARAALLAEVLAVFAHPGFAAALAPGSRAEVEIAARLGGATVSGRIDRLAVTAGRVLIVDYKTNRPAPRDLAAVPPQYVAQLALYRAVLRGVYPAHIIEAALLWTDGPDLMPIPAQVLDAAEKAILSPARA